MLQFKFVKKINQFKQKTNDFTKLNISFSGLNKNRNLQQLIRIIVLIYVKKN